MAMICPRCGGIIPDVMLGGLAGKRHECRYHTKVPKDVRI